MSTSPTGSAVSRTPPPDHLREYLAKEGDEEEGGLPANFYDPVALVHNRLATQEGYGDGEFPQRDIEAEPLGVDYTSGAHPHFVPRGAPHISTLTGHAMPIVHGGGRRGSAAFSSGSSTVSAAEGAGIPSNDYLAGMAHGAHLAGQSNREMEERLLGRIKADVVANQGKRYDPTIVVNPRKKPNRCLQVCGLVVALALLFFCGWRLYLENESYDPRIDVSPDVVYGMVLMMGGLLICFTLRRLCCSNGICCTRKKDDDEVYVGRSRFR